jgi:hypothetical protein
VLPKRKKPRMLLDPTVPHKRLGKVILEYHLPGVENPIVTKSSVVVGIGEFCPKVGLERRHQLVGTGSQLLHGLECLSRR